MTRTHPERIERSWAYVHAAADSPYARIERRRDNPDATQPEQYVRLSLTCRGANTAVYLIYGSARLEVNLPWEHAADYQGRTGVRFGTKNPDVSGIKRIYLQLGDTAEARHAVIELTRRALAYETHRALINH
ncbi:hypothetical protein [Streptomyces sp. NPDC091371]|uniref:hypothetical protein n=1 Tax=Streptomyces sp. NPDC091371 TaxID=3155303 RepID=UPI00341FA082